MKHPSIYMLLALLLICNAGYSQIGGSVHSRHPLSVAMRIEDTNGNAQVGARLNFRERGWRLGFLDPYGPGVMKKGDAHEVVSDATGTATVSFRDDYLDLEKISVGEHAVTNFTVVFYRFDGHSFTNQFLSYHSTQHRDFNWTLMYGSYPHAKDPWRETYTITIK